MNSSETLTCNFFQLPQDIFRVIFQYLSVEDLMKGEEAFLNNQVLLSLYRSYLEGCILQEKIKIEDKGEKLISWIIDHKLLVEMLQLWKLEDLEMNLLNHSRSSLVSIELGIVEPDSVPVISQFGHFPSLTAIFFESIHSFTNDQLLSFFSQNPQLEIVHIADQSELSNEILTHLSNYCPKIKILSLLDNDWVNDETITLLTQQRLFPNLMFLNIRDTSCRNQDTLRQFFLSHPLLSGIYLPKYIQYSNDFLVFYLRQVIFPSILSNNNDLESHSLSISSLCNFVEGILGEKSDLVNPEIFSVDILSHLYQKDTHDDLPKIFYYLSQFPSMIDSILQSQFIPFILNSPSTDDFLSSGHLVDLLLNCGVFHDYFPLLVEKYRTRPSSLIGIFRQVIQNHFLILTTEEFQIMIPIVLNELPNKDSTSWCLQMITKLLLKPSSQLLVDPNTLLLSLKSIDFVSYYHSRSLIECLERFISLDENYQQLLIESNLIPQIMRLIDTESLINFTKHCLVSSPYELLTDHLVNSGLFQYLLPHYSHNQYQIESLFELLIKFKNNKYSEIVKEMKLPDELRVKLFEKKEKKKKSTNKVK